jgi:membrane protease YdiL (CAAX protease family)
MIMNKKWFRIAFFYLVAVAFSYSMRYPFSEWYKNITLPFGFSSYKSWIQGFGPLFGAILVTWIFSVQRKNTLFGSSKNKSLLMGIVPVAVLSIAGVNNNEGLGIHYYGFILGFWIIVYGIFEESGWRGYLHDELRGIKPVLKYFIIGTLWYIWHFTFLRDDTTFKNELIIYSVLVLAGWGIGQIAEKTNSILACGCFHTIGNIMGLSEIFRTNLTPDQKYLI